MPLKTDFEESFSRELLEMLVDGVRLENPQNHSAAIVIVPVGRESCKTTPTMFVVCPLPCNRGNKARNVLVESSIVKTVGSVREKPEAEHHFRVEKVVSLYRVM
jgi:hypothetical protein